MNFIWVLLIVLVIAAIVGAPGIGPWQHQYGWAPSGGVGLVLLVLLVLLLLGKI